MQIPEKKAEISSHSDLASIFGFSTETFARSNLAASLIAFLKAERDATPLAE